MAERDLIAAIRAALSPRSARVIEWIGDDCSVVAPGIGVMVTSLDVMVEGTHFTLETAGPADVGHRALAGALSDIAAMGAEAGEAYLGIVIPPHLGEEDVVDLHLGAEALARSTGTTIAGGDITRGPALVVAVTVTGWTQRPVLRSGATPGDVVLVSGELGGSAAGLAALQRGERDGAAIARHRRPQPRLELGARLNAAGATAMIDLSDGIATDAVHLARAAGVRLVLDAAALPVADGATIEQAATGGEDYELLTCMPRDAHPIEGTTVIGEVVAGPPGVDWIAAPPEAATWGGWDPFG